jgi:hypothetical protein
MPVISGQFHGDDIGMAGNLGCNHIPGAVARTVVDQNQFKAVADRQRRAFAAASDQFGEAGFLVEAGDDDRQP